MRVLVIDDDEDGASMLAELLGDLGHDVAIARDGEIAIGMDASWNPDAIILDLLMPGVDGHEVARRLRARRPGVHIVALSGLARSEDRERSREAGCNVHLTKPASLDEIVRALTGAS